MINIEETNLEYTLKNSQKDDWNFYIIQNVLFTRV